MIPWHPWGELLVTIIGVHVFWALVGASIFLYATRPAKPSGVLKFERRRVAR